MVAADARTAITCAIHRHHFTFVVAVFFQHAPVMLCKCVIHTPFAMPDSFLPLVVCVLHLLRERRDFADFCDAVNWCLATEGAVRTAPVVVELPLFKSLSISSSVGAWWNQNSFRSVSRDLCIRICL
jgi:hypothetical protein